MGVAQAPLALMPGSGPAGSGAGLSSSPLAVLFASCQQMGTGLAGHHVFPPAVVQLMCVCVCVCVGARVGVLISYTATGV